MGAAMIKVLMSNIVRVLFVVFAIQFIVGSALAETITLGANGWKPYVTFNADGIASGLAIDKVNQISSVLNISMQVVDRPFKRVLSDAKTGNLHGVLLSANRKERREYLAFSAPIFCERRILFAHKGRSFNWKNIDELKGKTIGMGIGYFKGKVIQSWIDDGIVNDVYEAQDSSLFKLLIKDRIDFVVYSEKEARTILDANPEMTSEISALSPALDSVELHIGFSIRRNGQENAMNANKVIRENGLSESC